jgi:hypothetical protein
MMLRPALFGLLRAASALKSTKGLVMRCEWEPEQVSPTEPSWTALKNKVDAICGPTRALEFADTSDLDRREHPRASEAIRAVETGNPSAWTRFKLRRAAKGASIV